MPGERDTTDGPAAGATKPRLPARVFYGVIVAGVVLGASLAALGGWGYLTSDDPRPTGRRIWADVTSFVVPVAVMMGATFGGVLGFVVAAVWERRAKCDSPARSASKGE